MAASQSPANPDAAFRAHLLGQLTRIANALEDLARASAPEAPNYQRPMSEYPTFNWDSVGARVVNTDEFGPTQVEWGDYLWSRRSPQNKFGEAIWYSRANGKDGDGNNKYVRLISFKKTGEVEPLPSKVQKAVVTEVEKAGAVIEGGKPAPALASPAPTETEQIPPKTEQQAGAVARSDGQSTSTASTAGKALARPAVALTLDDLAAIRSATYPSDCIRLLDGKEDRYQVALIVEIGHQFKIKDAAVMEIGQMYRRANPPDWKAALKELDRKI